MTNAVVAGAIVVAALNAAAALAGGWLWYRSALSERGVRVFWLLLRTGQGAALAFAVGVGSLALAGHYSSDRLFYLYALLPLAVAFVGEQLRVAAAASILAQHDLAGSAAVGRLPEQEQRGIVIEIVRREIGVMALSALVVSFLALRAAGTAHGF